MAVSGNIVRTLWTILDVNDAPLTGMTSPADVTFTLYRDSGTAMVVATETITMVEVGASGHYGISFTPVSTGLYVLELREIDAATQLRTARFDFQVLTAGAIFVPSYANAFCSEADIERWLQQGISSTTKPSDTEAAGFAETRAARLMSLCAGLGYPVSPSTLAAGSRLEDLLRDANAIGAAMDYTVAQSFGTGPSKTDRATYLDGLWKDYVDSKTGIIPMELKMNLVSLATDYIISGDTVAAAVTYPTDAGIQVAMTDTF